MQSVRAIAMFVLTVFLWTGGATGAAERTFDHLIKSAEAGGPGAVHNLGVKYMRGLGVPQDIGLAARLWQRAAEQGFIESQYNLGILHEIGAAVPQDHAIARRWFEKAAHQGYAKAQLKMGNYLHRGLAGPANIHRAIGWYRKAAAQGDSIAQSNLWHHLPDVRSFVRHFWYRFRTWLTDDA